MSRLVLTSALALGTLAVIGGFTPGVATAEAAPDVSPFAGSWSGTWDIAAIQDHRGTFDWTISDAGGITGTVTNTTSGDSGRVKGHVGVDGKLTFVGYAPADDPSGSYPFLGTAVIDGDGKLAVAATGMFNAFPYNHVDGWLVATLERN
jgi:hypothetical protein